MLSTTVPLLSPYFLSKSQQLLFLGIKLLLGDDAHIKKLFEFLEFVDRRNSRCGLHNRCISCSFDFS